MSTLLIIITILIFIILTLITAIKPVTSSLSSFELERRAHLGDKHAKQIIEREASLIGVISLQNILKSLLLVAFALLCILAFSWLVGTAVVIFVVFTYEAIADLSMIRKLSNKVYSKFETRILKLIKKNSYIFKLIHKTSETKVNYRIDSREELQHLVDASAGVLSSDEKKLVVNSLAFGDKLVNSIMTPRSVIDSIKNTEFLGPLTLSELHKTGHSRLPVVQGDIDHIVGILNLKELLTLDIKKSKTAEKAMDPKVYYIRQDQTLLQALSAFLRTHHHLFIVVNESQETVGILSLEDVIEALIGRKIIDEFDVHDNLRQVALRNPHENNHPIKR